MNLDHEQFLKLTQLPARLNIEQAGWYLGFSDEEISILISKGTIKPLGKPAANGRKFFAAVTLSQLRANERWLAQASDTIAGHWRQRNEYKGRRRREPAAQLLQQPITPENRSGQ